MRLALAIILVFAIVFPVFSQETSSESSDEWYQGKPIRRIVFDGLSHVKASELEGITDPFIGRIFSDSVYWDILGRLYALEYFETITPTAIRGDTPNDVIIRFTVVERPTVRRILFSGNAGLRRSELSDEVSIKIGDVVTMVKLRMDEQAIIKKYLDKGFPDIKVSAETQSAPGGTVNVLFNIVEGERITIEEFLFEGNAIFKDRVLRRQLSLKVKGIINDGAFNEAKLIADKQALAAYYHDRGYIDAEVLDAVREIRKDDKGNNRMTITFRIFEGRLYTFGGITFEGNKIFPTEQLSALVTSKKGETVNSGKVRADLMRIADLYYEHGYIFNRIEPIPVQDAEAGTISYNVSIIERGRAHIENIVVKGNEKTKDWVILREIPLQSGDVFSKAKVMDGLRNLYNLQYFSMVTPDTPPGSADALMDLIITVEEQPTIDLQIGLTFSGSSDPDTFPISVMAKWTDKNFRGYGNLLGAETTISPDTQVMSAQYTQRWLFGLPLSGSFDLTVQHMSRKAAMDNLEPFFNGDGPNDYPDGFNSYEEYINADKIPPDAYLMPYDQWKISLGASTGYRWLLPAGNFGVGGGIRIGVQRNAYDTNIYRPFDPVLRNENSQWAPALSIWGSVSLDKRDLFYDPSSGYYLSQRFAYQGILPIEHEHYIRTDTKAEWFWTLFNIPVGEVWAFKMVFGVHSGLSFILPKPWDDIPKVEEANQLAVDGMFIGRGWLSDYRRKGFALWENWAEFRIPLAPGILALDLFFDAAGVKKDFTAFFTEFSKADDTGAFFMRFSFGPGLRFTIPQFPFRFSVAKRFIFKDGSFEWVKGGMGNSGWDFVISFALTTY